MTTMPGIITFGRRVLAVSVIAGGLLVTPTAADAEGRYVREQVCSEERTQSDMLLTSCLTLTQSTASPEVWTWHVTLQAKMTEQQADAIDRCSVHTSQGYLVGEPRPIPGFPGESTRPGLVAGRVGRVTPVTGISLRVWGRGFGRGLW